jgi:hypothetical protein
MTNRFVKLAAVTGLLVMAPLSMSDAQQDRGARQNRAQMEQRFRQRLANLLRTQLGLSDDEMRQLSDVNQRFDVQRREVNRREMMTRRSMREEVLKRDSANAGRIEQLLTEQFKIERERIDLTEAEQRELSRFLTPMQRARYLGVQEQIRREMDQLRGRRAGPMDGPPPGDRRRPPPGS